MVVVVVVVVLWRRRGEEEENVSCRGRPVIAQGAPPLAP